MADPVQNGLLLRGEMINLSEVPRQLKAITGVFYNEQGQLIADQPAISGRWPVDTVPPGAQVPFELTVQGLQHAADFDLIVRAEPGAEAPQQNFEFLDVSTSLQAGDYCLMGAMKNPGTGLQDYLVIVAILYNSQDQVLNFAAYHEPYLDALQAAEFFDFEVCANPNQQEVARYQLRAWGQ